ncbi:hypothetical protein FJ365_01330 [Candidatus Dependentiae bacterium]|nr:hypothetical protein [Candidatus Dependentiae bacterium]
MTIKNNSFSLLALLSLFGAINPLLSATAATPSSITIPPDWGNFNPLNGNSWYDGWVLNTPGQGVVTFKVSIADNESYFHDAAIMFSEKVYPIPETPSPYPWEPNTPVIHSPGYGANAVWAAIRGWSGVESELRLGGGANSAPRNLGHYRHQALPLNTKTIFYRVTLDQPNGVFIVEESISGTWPTITNANSYNPLFCFNPNRNPNYPTSTTSISGSGSIPRGNFYQYFAFSNWNNKLTYSDITISDLPTAPPPVTPTIITCTEQCQFSYRTTSGIQKPSWFEAWKTPTPGYFLVAFTTNARQDICLAFSPTKLAGFSTAATYNLPLKITIGAFANSKLYLNVNAMQRSGIEGGYAADVTIPANYSSVTNYSTLATTILLELNVNTKTLRLWSSSPANPSTYTKFFDSSTLGSDNPVTRAITALNNTASQLQYIGFAKGYPPANASIQYGEITFNPTGLPSSLNINLAAGSPAALALQTANNNLEGLIDTLNNTTTLAQMQTILGATPTATYAYGNPSITRPIDTALITTLSNELNTANNAVKSAGTTAITAAGTTYSTNTVHPNTNALALAWSDIKLRYLIAQFQSPSLAASALSAATLANGPYNSNTLITELNNAYIETGRTAPHPTATNLANILNTLAKDLSSEISARSSTPSLSALKTALLAVQAAPTDITKQNRFALSITAAKTDLAALKNYITTKATPTYIQAIVDANKFADNAAAQNTALTGPSGAIATANALLQPTLTAINDAVKMLTARLNASGMDEAALDDYDSYGLNLITALNDASNALNNTTYSSTAPHPEAVALIAAQNGESVAAQLQAANNNANALKAILTGATTLTAMQNIMNGSTTYGTPPSAITAATVNTLASALNSANNNVRSTGTQAIADAGSLYSPNTSHPNANALTLAWAHLQVRYLTAQLNNAATATTALTTANSTEVSGANALITALNKAYTATGGTAPHPAAALLITAQNNANSMNTLQTAVQAATATMPASLVSATQLASTAVMSALTPLTTANPTVATILQTTLASTTATPAAKAQAMQNAQAALASLNTNLNTAFPSADALKAFTDVYTAANTRNTDNSTPQLDALINSLQAAISNIPSDSSINTIEATATLTRLQSAWNNAKILQAALALQSALGPQLALTTAANNATSQLSSLITATAPGTGAIITALSSLTNATPTTAAALQTALAAPNATAASINSALTAAQAALTTVNNNLTTVFPTAAAVTTFTTAFNAANAVPSTPTGNTNTLADQLISALNAAIIAVPSGSSLSTTQAQADYTSLNTAWTNAKILHAAFNLKTALNQQIAAATNLTLASTLTKADSALTNAFGNLIAATTTATTAIISAISPITNANPTVASSLQTTLANTSATPAAKAQAMQNAQQALNTLSTNLATVFPSAAALANFKTAFTAANTPPAGSSTSQADTLINALTAAISAIPAGSNINTTQATTNLQNAQTAWTNAKILNAAISMQSSLTTQAAAGNLNATELAASTSVPLVANLLNTTSLATDAIITTLTSLTATSPNALATLNSALNTAFPSAAALKDFIDAYTAASAMSTDGKTTQVDLLINNLQAAIASIPADSTISTTQATATLNKLKTAWNNAKALVTALTLKNSLTTQAATTALQNAVQAATATMPATLVSATKLASTTVITALNKLTSASPTIATTLQNTLASNTATPAAKGQAIQNAQAALATLNTNLNAAFPSANELKAFTDAYTASYNAAQNATPNAILVALDGAIKAIPIGSNINTTEAQSQYNSLYYAWQNAQTLTTALNLQSSLNQQLNLITATTNATSTISTLATTATPAAIAALRAITSTTENALTTLNNTLATIFTTSTAKTAFVNAYTAASALSDGKITEADRLLTALNEAITAIPNDSTINTTQASTSYSTLYNHWQNAKVLATALNLQTQLTAAASTEQLQKAAEQPQQQSPQPQPQQQQQIQGAAQQPQAPQQPTTNAQPQAQLNTEQQSPQPQPQQQQQVQGTAEQPQQSQQSTTNQQAQDNAVKTTAVTTQQKQTAAQTSLQAANIIVTDLITALTQATTLEAMQAVKTTSATVTEAIRALNNQSIAANAPGSLAGVGSSLYKPSAATQPSLYLPLNTISPNHPDSLVLMLAWADFQVRYLTAQLTALSKQNPIIVPAAITNNTLTTAINNITTALNNMAYTPRGIGGKNISVNATNDPARYAAQQGAGSLYSTIATSNLTALNKALADLLIAVNTSVTTLTSSLKATNPGTIAEAYVAANTIPSTPPGNTSTQAQLYITALNRVNALLTNNTAAQALAPAHNKSTLYNGKSKNQKSLYTALTSKAPNHPDATALNAAITAVIAPITTLVTALKKADDAVVADIINLSATPAPVTRAKATGLGNQYTKNIAALTAAINAMNGSARTPSAALQQAAQTIANQLARPTLPATVSLPEGIALSSTLYSNTNPHPDATVLATVIKTLK